MSLQSALGVRGMNELPELGGYELAVNGCFRVEAVDR